MELFDELQQKVTHIFNLDAIYDLAIPEKIDRIVNTIIRSRFVKGHSQTGETIIFDGRYFNLNFLDPYISSERETVVNLVTIDYIIQTTLSPALYNEGRENLSFNWSQPKLRLENFMNFSLMNCIRKTKRPYSNGTKPSAPIKGPMKAYLGQEDP
ncbi:hypothetical protein SAMN05444672_1268 [Bacillus sp. OK838]|nr:hypothetical protein SAMN05444672_1268 [Bacillus sp. OK838]